MATWISPSLTFTAYRKPAVDFEWTKRYSKTLRQTVAEMKPPENTIAKPIFLVMGASSAGKSAFLNSVASISKNRIASPTNAALSASSQITTVYRRFRPVSGVLTNFVLSDIMGISSSSDTEILLDDIKLLVNGHLKEGYEFDLKKPVDKEGDYYISAPTEEDKTQCVIFVIDGSKPINSDVKYLQDFAQLNRELYKQGIPIMAVLTKVDVLCSYVRGNINYIYHSKPVRDKILALHEVTGIDISHIHPLKNYTNEHYTNDMKDIPILIALKTAFEFANDYLEQLQSAGKIVLRQEKI